MYVMTQNAYIWYNGEFHRADSMVLAVSNRSFRYGDGLFETIHCYGTEPYHLELHYERLTKGLQILEIEKPSSISKVKLGEVITKLLNKNRHFGSTRVRVTVFRNGEGLYTPESSDASIIVESQPLDFKFYAYNQQGLIVDVYPDIKKSVNILSTVKSCNALLYVKAGLYRKRNLLDECIILNEFGRVAETISSNVFVVKRGEIFTPGLTEGCIPGIMRRVVINLARSLGYKVFDDVALNTKVFSTCDEFFITNAISGIRWVLGLGSNRYFNTVSRHLSIELNKATFKDLV